MKTKRKIEAFIRQYLEDGQDCFIPDGMEPAFIGLGVQFNRTMPVFDYDLCISALCRKGMSEEDAHEWMHRETIGAWHGEGTPLFVMRYTEARK